MVARRLDLRNIEMRSEMETVNGRPLGARGRVMRLALAVLAAFAMSLTAAQVANAEFGISEIDTETHRPLSALGIPTQHWSQAGAHVDATLSFRVNTKTDEFGYEIPDGALRDVVVDLPAGLVGNPRAVPRCQPAQFNDLQGGSCALATQVGVAYTELPSAIPTEPNFLRGSGVYNLVPAEGELAAFGFYVMFVPVKVVVELREDGDYGVRTTVQNISQASTVFSQRITFWGVPADPVHDHERMLGSWIPGFPSGAPLRPFLSLPTACEGPVTTVMQARPWGSEEWVTAESVSDNPDTGEPEGPQECERVPFEGSFAFSPDERQAGAPAGYTGRLRTTYNDTPSGLSTSHLKHVRVTLPEGVAVNPSSADGLVACSDDDLGLGRKGDSSCPEASKVGSVEIDTPVLDERLAGEVYVREPLPGQLFRLAIVARARGSVIKIAGDVDPDPVDGQLTAIFENNPQLPFEEMRMRLKSGPRAPLANPRGCGAATTSATLSPWSGNAPIVSESSFEVIGDCERGSRFEPSLQAGTASPAAGRFSPFSMVIAKGDGQQDLRSVEARMPRGVLAKLAGVPLCSEAQANAGTCGAESRVGHVQASAGAGSSPLWVPQAGKAPTSVSLAGPYKGAPYSLVAMVPAQAGPYDLGKIVVRVALHVDRSTAQVTAISDPLPHILEGVPLNTREVRVLIDRRDFTLNPTSCAVKQTEATVGALQGASSTIAARFQAGDCASLPFRPKLSLALTGKGQRTTGKHPGVKAVVRQTGIGEAGIGRAKVTLPRSVALDPDNAQALCEFADGTKPDLESRCPKGSIVGKATARTPLLDRPLSGNVYFVKNVRRDPKTGNEIRTLPMIVVALRGQIAINLRGESSTAKDGRLVNTFASVPDAPISRFDLKIAGGGNGILAVTRTRRARINLCSKPKSHRAVVEMDGHNGKQADDTVRVKTPCAVKKASKRKRTRSR